MSWNWANGSWLVINLWLVNKFAKEENSGWVNKDQKDDPLLFGLILSGTPRCALGASREVSNTLDISSARDLFSSIRQSTIYIIWWYMGITFALYNIDFRLKIRDKRSSWQNFLVPGSFERFRFFIYYILRSHFLCK